MSSFKLNESGLGSAFKAVQKDFITWAANWVRNEEHLEPISYDLPDVVNLLLAMGFRITHMDVSTTNSPLRGGKHGSRIVVTCSHSGQRCVIEKPNDETNCTCTKMEAEDSMKDAFWEVTASAPNNRQGLIEAGSDLIPQLTKEQTYLIRNVVNYLFFVIKQNMDGDKNSLSSTPLSSRSERRSDGFYNMKPDINSTPNRKSLGSIRTSSLIPIDRGLDSPARYRSLDTLTAKDADVGLPEPGKLIPKISVQNEEKMTVQSSPNIKLSSDDTESTIEDCSIGPKAMTLLKNASQTLLKAIKLIESNSSRDSSRGSAIEDKIASASKNIKKLICTSKPPPSTKNLKTTSSSNLLVRNSTIPKGKSTSTLNITAKIKTSVRSESVSSIPKPEGVTKKNDKYAHVKSTISRRTEPKKKEERANSAK